LELEKTGLSVAFILTDTADNERLFKNKYSCWCSEFLLIIYYTLHSVK